MHCATLGWRQKIYVDDDGDDDGCELATTNILSRWAKHTQLMQRDMMK